MTASTDIAIEAMAIATLLLNFGFAALVGAVLTRWHISASTATTTSASTWSRSRDRRLRQLIFVSSAGVLTMLLVVLVLETATMAEVHWHEVSSSIADVLTSTHFGHMWLASVGIVAFNTLLHLPAQASRRRAVLSMIVLAIFAISRSLVSHAVAAGAFSWQVGIDAAHLLLVSVWLGEVLIAGVIMLRTPCGPALDDRRECGGYVMQLSTSATIALAVIVVTGLINSWRGMGSAGNLSVLTNSAWGWILLFKVGGVAIAAMLGALNRWGAMPNFLLHLRSSSLASVPAQRRFALTLQIESVILTAVLLAAAMLSSSAPPASL